MTTIERIRVTFPFTSFENILFFNLLDSEIILKANTTIACIDIISHHNNSYVPIELEKKFFGTLSAIGLEQMGDNSISFLTNILSSSLLKSQMSGKDVD